MTKNQKKFKALYETILALSPIYLKEEDEYTRDQYETIVGAGIFYLDSSKKLFTGMISEGSKKADCVKEHRYPRKISAMLLLQSPPATLEQFVRQYYSEYGTYNLVTKSENARLKPFQKKGEFSSPEESYRLAGIALESLAEDSAKRKKK